VSLAQLKVNVGDRAAVCPLLLREASVGRDPTAGVRFARILAISLMDARVGAE
jgi:hypothetical protein